MKSNHLEMVPYFANTGIEKQVKKKAIKRELATLPGTVTSPPEPWEETEGVWGEAESGSPPIFSKSLVCVWEEPGLVFWNWK